ncbi:MAG: DUF721 domain-containing protein [bacterium]|nr:DUF721 domain-containing protein [bacterium]
MAHEPVKIGDILWQSIDTLEFKRNIYPKLIELSWHHILGSTLAQHCKFRKIEKDKIYIKVNSPEWFKELNDHKPLLIEKINRYFNKPLIADIELELPAYARPKPKPRTRPRNKKNCSK